MTIFQRHPKPDRQNRMIQVPILQTAINDKRPGIQPGTNRHMRKPGLVRRNTMKFRSPYLGVLPNNPADGQQNNDQGNSYGPSELWKPDGNHTQPNNNEKQENSNHALYGPPLVRRSSENLNCRP